MTSAEIREKFLTFFRERGHAVAKASSLIPEDPSVLLTTAGMQQFKKYFTGELDAFSHLGSKSAVSIQKSFRTSDIDEVGDMSHLTFFEMLGNFSFGGYFKHDAINFAYEFITEEMKLQVSYVTVFDPDKVPEGDWRKGVPFDKESYGIWKNEVGLPEEKIKREGQDNFWGPTGSEGPCGPTTEIYVKNSEGQAVEIWNIVFNEYFCSGGKELKNLPFFGIDTGMGLERLSMVSQGVPTIFETDLFQKPLERVFKGDNDKSEKIVADHIRGITFLLADGVRPSNKERGYILRRLTRRAILHSKKIALEKEIPEFIDSIIEFYGDFYEELKEKREEIQREYEIEAEKFNRTLEKGLKSLEEQISKRKDLNSEKIAEICFDLYQNHGLPIDVSIDEIESREIDFDKAELREKYEKKFEEHQNISRSGQEKKFGGHGLLLNTGELKAGSEEELKKVVRLHTATHLLQEALRRVLGKEVKQMGSDITAERTRFDFSFGRKLTSEETGRVEEIVNEIIKKKMPVRFVELSKEDAEKTGALYFFKGKYPERVKVYFVGEDLENSFSKEFCGGPHVENTEEIGSFKILKEEGVAQGVRRIRGTVN